MLTPQVIMINEEAGTRLKNLSGSQCFFLLAQGAALHNNEWKPRERHYDCFKIDPKTVRAMKKKKYANQDGSLTALGIEKRKDMLRMLT